jgi:hypothetical protein
MENPLLFSAFPEKLYLYFKHFQQKPQACFPAESTPEDAAGDSHATRNGAQSAPQRRRE